MRTRRTRVGGVLVPRRPHTKATPPANPKRRKRKATRGQAPRVSFPGPSIGAATRHSDPAIKQVEESAKARKEAGGILLLTAGPCLWWKEGTREACRRAADAPGTAAETGEGLLGKGTVPVGMQARRKRESRPRRACVDGARPRPPPGLFLDPRWPAVPA